MNVAKKKLIKLNTYKFTISSLDEEISNELTSICPRFSRYENKIFLILILKRVEHLNQISFSEKELYSIKEFFKLKLGNDYVEIRIKYKSIEYNEFLTISNPVAVFGSEEIPYIEKLFDSSCSKYDSDDYIIFDKTKYMDNKYKPYVLKNNENKTIEDIIVNFHSQVLAFIRAKAFEDELDKKISVLDKLKRLNKVMEEI